MTLIPQTIYGFYLQKGYKIVIIHAYLDLL
jgi:hypothetical protein